VLFWDFDGVIKDSVEVKSDAYQQLFCGFGSELAARVRAHHECHGGMSRFAKIPLYLEWAGQASSLAEIERYCELFAMAVRQAVVDSPWVAGAREYLEANHARQRFVLLTATPQEEIEDIVGTLQIAYCFQEVHGAPTAKADAIASVLDRWDLPRAQALVIGDSHSDYEAAVANGVEFLLRRTPLNITLQRRFSGLQCDDFTQH
jgi:phosphoglycolate phosphatase-like HAD superfamily hydrolase